jgi:hypothetical protein
MQGAEEPRLQHGAGEPRLQPPPSGVCDRVQLENLASNLHLLASVIASHAIMV